MSVATGKYRGFTIIELMLAMTFLSILLLAIAMLTIQVGNIYNRGVTLREVNLAGSEISNDLQRAIQSSSVFDLTINVDEDGSLVENSNYVVFDNGPDDRETGGRLCMGRYSYVWNYGSTLAQRPEDSKNNYSDGTPVKFAKVADTGELCRADESNTYQDIPAEAVDMLADLGRNIAIHELSINSNDRGLYSISFVIGTNDASAFTDDALTDDRTCRPPSDLQSDINYCAINRFSIVTKAGSL